MRSSHVRTGAPPTSCLAQICGRNIYCSSGGGGVVEKAMSRY